jgi:hypothetical protein
MVHFFASIKKPAGIIFMYSGTMITFFFPFVTFINSEVEALAGKKPTIMECYYC